MSIRMPKELNIDIADILPGYMCHKYLKDQERFADITTFIQSNIQNGESNRMSVELQAVHRKADNPHVSTINITNDETDTKRDAGVENKAYQASTDSLANPVPSQEPEVSPDDIKVSHKPNGVDNIPVKAELGPQIETDYEDDEEPDCCARAVGKVQYGLSNSYKSNKKIIWNAIYIFLIIGYFVYFGFAMAHRFGDEGSIRLLWVTCLVVFCSILYTIYKMCGGQIAECIKPMKRGIKEKWYIIRWFFIIAAIAFVIVILIVEVALKNPYNLTSAAGLVVYVLLFYIFSYSPAKVKWTPVLMGLLLQFIFALVILRTWWGYEAFKWLGDRVTEFLAHTNAGAQFVFGDAYQAHFFAFSVLPTVVFFSTAISVLYYLGWMQTVIKGVALVMQHCMGTTAAESLNAAGNIFIGQSEAPLMIRPLIKDMTRSELHAVMTGGFATIAGSVLAAYILFGVPANHLLSASVMSAPAALAMSKLFYPETEKSRTTAKDVRTMEKPPEKNIVAAASSGASMSVKLVANIAANLIAFIALLAFVNATLTWLGHRVGLEKPDYPELTFQLICSYLLWPFAFLMGADSQDCRQVASLIGTKTFINEFVAYGDLGVLIENKRVSDMWYDQFHNPNDTTVHQVISTQDDILFTNVMLNGTAPKDLIYNLGTNVTLIGGILTRRSEIIATYALCGFANLGSIGVMLGALGAMAPNRKPELASIAVRAMIAGNVACFMTACIAGLLYEEESTLLGG
ncbi:unnamed protein product [Owenia fusiformis]|uniref:Sodium/nucleoside cotransporter n=1 Tax=Owenia fusiformis TaxID=6347 RepID=A0A8S4PGV2_OWEFU|nr:unnamed protein product [Owenia fusiformis]